MRYLSLLLCALLWSAIDVSSAEMFSSKKNPFKKLTSPLKRGSSAKAPQSDQTTVLTHITIKTLKQLRSQLEQHGIKLSETAIFLHFDEVLALKVLEREGHIFKLAFAASAPHIYSGLKNYGSRDVHEEAVVKAGLSDGNMKSRFESQLATFEKSNEKSFTYEPLEQEVKSVVGQLKWHSGFIGTYSQKPISSQKALFLKRIGLTPGLYFRTDAKQQHSKYAAIQHALATIPKSKRIRAVVIVENRPDHVEGVLKKSFPHLKTIVVHSQTFDGMMTKDALTQEYKALADMMGLTVNLRRAQNLKIEKRDNIEVNK